MLVSLLVLIESQTDIQCNMLPIAVVLTLSFVYVGVHVDTRDDYDWTPLCHAVVAENVSMVQFLLSQRE